MKRSTFLHYLEPNSIYFGISFPWKFLLFVALSVLPLLIHNLLVNLLCLVCVLAMLLGTGYYQHRPSSATFLLASFGLFMVVWFLFSTIEGTTVYIVFPWHTYISDQTVIVALTAATRWLLVCQAGLLFLVVTTQNEVIDTLIAMHTPYRFVLTLTIALNTIAFILEVIPQIEAALDSRNVPNNSIIEKMDRVRLIGSALLAESIIRIAFLRAAYHLDVHDLELLELERTSVEQNKPSERSGHWPRSDL